MRKLLWLPDEETPEFLRNGKIENPDWWSLMSAIRELALKKEISSPEEQPRETE